jgi:hypothetical protein
MYGSVDEWRSSSREDIAAYARLRHQIDQLEAVAAAQLGQLVEAHRWPEEIPVPTRRDTFGTEEIAGELYAEDFTSELALAQRTTPTATHYLVGDVAQLIHDLPRCWDKVTSGQAPLWQARRVIDACANLPVDVRHLVDERVAPALGALATARLLRLAHAAVRAAWATLPAEPTPDPDAPATPAPDPDRWVKTGGSDFDTLTGWVSARLDRADAIHLDATVQLIADTLAAHGDTRVEDERRAAALGLLANPAAAIQLTGVHTLRGMAPTPAPTPATDEGRQAFVKTATGLLPAFTPRTQVYVHLWDLNAAGPDALARVEGIGPLLAERLHHLTRASRVKLTPVIHTSADIAVDAYEVPQAIRDQVLATHSHSCSPWAATESRNLDLDHVKAWRPDGPPGQTSPANLAPLTRKSHRVKTHAGWQFDHPEPGVYIWRSPAGQVVRVDPPGTHHIPARQ